MKVNERRLRRIFAISGTIGEVLQKDMVRANLSPADGVLCLLVCIGRLMAREAYMMAASEAWDTITNGEMSFAFTFGFNEERKAGNSGRPRPD